VQGQTASSRGDLKLPDGRQPDQVKVRSGVHSRPMPPDGHVRFHQLRKSPELRNRRDAISSCEQLQQFLDNNIGQKRTAVTDCAAFNRAMDCGMRRNYVSLALYGHKQFNHGCGI
jgi:hypothetical protein